MTKENPVGPEGVVLSEKELAKAEKHREMVREYMRTLGSRGGKATLKKHGKKHFSKIGVKGVETQAKLKKRRKVRA